MLIRSDVFFYFSNFNLIFSWMGNQGCCNHYPQEEGQKIMNPPLSSLHSPQHSQFDAHSSDQSTISRPVLSDPIEDLLNQLKPFQDRLPKNPKRIIIQGEVYEGQTKKGIANGYGKLYKSNGSLFVGLFHHGKVKDNEQGYYFNPDGSYYFGKFLDNQANDDYGKYYSGNFTYTGSFRNNKFQGKGREQNISYEFEGEYEDDKRKEGVLIWEENGEDFRYTGPFNSQQKFEGKGELEQPTGKYIGEFKNGKKHGKGEYIYKSKLRFVGEYKNGIKHGKGTIYNSDGTPSYEGQWKKGLPNGKGITQNKSGDRTQSEFLEGIDVKFMEQGYITELKNKKSSHQEHIDQDQNPSIIYDAK